MAHVAVLVQLSLDNRRDSGGDAPVTLRGPTLVNRRGVSSLARCLQGRAGQLSALVKELQRRPEVVFGDLRHELAIRKVAVEQP
jgi:hypothetical protein